MTGIAPRGAFVWGAEDPTRRIASARELTPIIPPSAYNKNQLTPSVPGSRVTAPHYAAQESAYAGAALAQRRRELLETGRATASNGYNASAMPTPSTSARYTPEPSPPSASYNKGMLERLHVGSPYTHIAAATGGEG